MTHQVFPGNGGWWGRLDGPGWFRERGPYPFRWMAAMSFPIERLTSPRIAAVLGTLLFWSVLLGIGFGLGFAVMDIWRGQ